MSRFYCPSLFLCLGVLATGPVTAHAQTYFVLGGGLSDKVMVKELKWSKEDLAKANKVVTATVAKYKDDIDKTKNLKPDERRTKMAALAIMRNEEIAKELETFLKEDQVKRLKQLEIQKLGIYAFRAPEVYGVMKFTPEQDKMINDIELASQKDTSADRMKKAVKKVEDLMDDDQKKEWKELIGERVFNK
jgi:hypothetical protein